MQQCMYFDISIEVSFTAHLYMQLTVRYSYGMSHFLRSFILRLLHPCWPGKVSSNNQSKKLNTVENENAAQRLYGNVIDTFRIILNVQRMGCEWEWLPVKVQLVTERGLSPFCVLGMLIGSPRGSRLPITWQLQPIKTLVDNPHTNTHTEKQQMATMFSSQAKA